jgi:hypothetical protein
MGIRTLLMVGTKFSPSAKICLAVAFIYNWAKAGLFDFTPTPFGNNSRLR